MERPTPYIKTRYRKGYKPRKKKYYPRKKSSEMENESANKSAENHYIADEVDTCTIAIERTSSSPQPGCSHWQDPVIDEKKRVLTTCTAVLFQNVLYLEQKMSWKTPQGDGDSSIIQRLARELPYGPELPIMKLECTNHLLRNYCNRLRELVRKSKNEKGLVPILLRKRLGDNLLRLRTAVTSAIAARSSTTTSKDSVNNLEKDIVNGPYHVFGDHGRCAEYFCKGPKEGECNLVPDLLSSGLWEEIVYCNSLLSRHATSLIKNVNNNYAEMYNAYVAKYIGGKRVNFSLRGAYTTRCEIAATAMNATGKLHEVLHRGLTNSSPGVYTKKFASSFSKEANLKRKRRLEFVGTSHRKHARTEGPDEHYGLNTGQAEDEVPSQETQIAFLSTLSLSKSARETLERETREQRLNKSWVTERWKRLTASSFGRVCKLRKTTSREKVADSILYPSFRGNKATKYGNANEKLAISAYEKASGNRVLPAGLFVDDNFPFLAASPDGVLSDGDGLVEVKCPYTCRDMTPEEGIEKGVIKCFKKKDGHYTLRTENVYHYQVQGQLNICKKQYCDLVFWSPNGILIERIERNHTFWLKNMESKLKEFYMKFLLPKICRQLRN